MRTTNHPVSHEQVAHAWLREPKNHGGRLRYYQSAFYRFNGESFRVLDDDAVLAELTRFAAEYHASDNQPVGSANPAVSISTSYLSNALNTARAYTIVSSDLPVPCWVGDGPARAYIAFKNGLVNRDALLAGPAPVEPHTPDWFSTTAVLPFDYRPTATCERWTQFLADVLERDPERISVLQEWFGYCLSPDTSKHKFLLLEGAGANGKSVIVKVLEGLLGVTNVSSVPIESFADRFALSATVGKLLNTCSEASKVSPRIEGLLKQFVGGDLLTVDRKHIEPLQFRPTARLIITTNKRPPFSDNSDGIWRRMLAMPFNVQVAEERQIQNLDQQLLEEASGILNWSIEGLCRLRQQGHFTRSAVMTETVTRFRAEDAPEIVFLRELFTEDPDAETYAAVAYDAYVTWARQTGERTLSQSEFGKLIKKLFPNVESVKLKTAAARDTRVYRYLRDRRVPATDTTLELVH